MPAYTPVAFTGNGTVGPYVVPWPYIAQSHVHVFVDDIEATFVWLTSSTIQLDAPAANGAEGRITRATPKDEPLVDWLNGADLSDDNLDLQARQVLFIFQESGLAAAEEAAAQAQAAAALAQAAAAAALAAPAVIANSDWFQFR